MADLLSDGRTPRARLRELIGGSAPLVAPGAYDALSARLIEQAGFDAVYMTGFGTTASLIGRPDVGLLSGAEMVDNARRIVSAVDVPVIADADTGYGNAINVVRTVQLYEQAGVAGIQLEDQVMPKKCGHMSGKLLVGADEMVGKLRAAVEARRDPDLLIIARTDAVAVTGVDDAIARARAFAEAGADLLFVEAPTSEDDIARVADRARRRRAAGLQLGRGRPDSPAVAGADRRARLRARHLPDRHAAGGDRRHPRAAGDPEGRRHAGLGAAGAAGVRRVHRPDRPAEVQRLEVRFSGA